MRGFFKENKLSLLRIAVSCLLLACGYVTWNTNVQISLGAYILSYLIASCTVFYSAVKELVKERTFAEKSLMVIASVGTMIIGQYLEGVSIMILFVIGEMFEHTAKESSRRSIESLATIRSDRVRIKGGAIIQATECKVGDIIEVLPGERIALDGTVIEGEGRVDTSVITGESNTRSVQKGSEVLAGFINSNTVLTIKVKRPLCSSAAQRIIDLAEKSLEKKTKSEKFIRKFARIYTPIIVGLSFVIAIVPPCVDLVNPIFGSLGFDFWLYKALSMLSVSCPCAFVISVPLAYFCGIGYASKKGILIRSSAVMDTLRNVEIVAFDKTGTLTRSELLVTRIDACDDIDKISLLKIVAIVEAKSNHPMALAITNEAKRFNISVPEGENYVETSGSGIECDSPYGHIKAGNRLYPTITRFCFYKAELPRSLRLYL